MSQPAAIAVNEGVLFQRLRWRLWRNTLHVVLRRALARVLTILFCSLLVWGGIFAISFLGFRELRDRWNLPLDLELFGLVFDLLFISLTVLLIFSTGIILYSSLFSAAESSFLLSAPVREDHIFAYKFQGAVAFSSWAFILLGSPILIAYGMTVGGGAPWYFYAVLPLFFLGFVLLPGSLGALFCLLLVNFVPRHRKQILVVVLLALGILLAVWIYRWVTSLKDFSLTRDWINQVVGEVSVISGPFVPAHWIARGLQSAALGEVSAMTYNLCLVWANGLFLYLLTAWTAGKLYRRGFNRVITGGTLRRRYGGGRLDNALSRLLFFLDPQTRVLIVKDFRTFRRDPAQWAQILIFLGLAVLYFWNVRQFYEQDIGRAFQNGISLLNLTATAFLMCAYTGRFIFPMLSLEGRKFWILGLLPLQRERLLWGKFAFAMTGSLLVAEFLVVFSNVMLNMPWQIVVVHTATVLVLSIGLSGLAVGLGACMPNFRETDPSKIAVGFGGTLNLVGGLLLLVVVIGLAAAPWHLVLARGQLSGYGLERVPWWVWPAGAAGTIAGLLAAILPLRAGAKALRGMEF
jgi:ABC-2 type transport system permease protein